MSKVKLISYTQPVDSSIPDSEALIAFTARVSNKDNQHNHKTAPKLVKWLVEHSHWSPLEMVNVCMEIQTVRAISEQIVRHKSFTGFQILSQRYTKPSVGYPELRLKGSTNRQGSINELATPELQEIANKAIDIGWEAYNHLVENGVALESARLCLPMNTNTTIYANASLRSWVHFIQVRKDSHAQKEIQIIAEECEGILKELYPNVMSVIEEVE